MQAQLTEKDRELAFAPVAQVALQHGLKLSGSESLAEQAGRGRAAATAQAEWQRSMLCRPCCHAVLRRKLGTLQAVHSGRISQTAKAKCAKCARLIAPIATNLA